MDKHKVVMNLELEFEVEGDFDFEDNHPWHQWDKFLSVDNITNVDVLEQGTL